MPNVTIEPGGAPRLGLATILPYSLANLPIAALSIAVLVYLPPYFAGHLKVAMATVGGVWMAIRLIDIPVDVVLALAMDRTRTRIGRYRPWLIAGAPVVMLGLYRLFMAPAGFSGVYLMSWLLTLYLGWSMMSLAHAAWGATLASTYDARSRLFGIVAAVGVVGSVAVLILPIVGRSLGRTDAQGIQAMGWALIVAAPVCAAIAVLRAPERIAPDPHQQIGPAARLSRHPAEAGSYTHVARAGRPDARSWLDERALSILRRRRQGLHPAVGLNPVAPVRRGGVAGRAGAGRPWRGGSASIAR